MDGKTLRRLFSDFGVIQYDQLKPSTFLYIMRILTHNKCSEQELKKIFLDLMPYEFRRVLVLRNFEDFSIMLKFADVLIGHVSGNATSKFILKNASETLRNERGNMPSNYEECLLAILEYCRYMKKSPDTDDNSEDKS